MRRSTPLITLLALAAQAPAQDLTVGETIEGDLSRADASGEVGRWQDIFTIALEAGESIVVDLRSQDFDAFLVVALPGGERLEDDDSGGQLNSRLAITATQRGSAEITVTSFAPSSGGRYSLSVSPIDIRPLVPGETHHGELTGAPAMLSLPVRWGEPLMIDVHSETLDTTLRLAGPDGASLFDDDGGEGRDSRLIYIPQASGEARLTVGSYDERGGSFTVAVEPVDALSLDLGRSVEGVVAEEPALAVLSLSEGQHVALALTAERPGCTFILTGPEGGRQEALAAPGRRNPKVVHEALSTGQAIIEVTAASPEEEIPFTLSAKPIDPVARGAYGAERPQAPVPPR
jgi:hypothetical protein